MSNLIYDVLSGNINWQQGNTAVRAAANMLKMSELQAKYGAVNPYEQHKSLDLIAKE